MLNDFSLRRFAVTWLLGGIVTVVATAVITGLTLTNHGWWGYMQLVQRGASAEAVVARSEPQNHCLAEYVFVMGGKQYRGDVADCGATVGQKVTVTYLPDDPNLSCLGAARERLNNEFAAFAAGGIVIPPIIIAAWRRKKRAA